MAHSLSKQHVLQELTYFLLAMHIKKIKKATWFESEKCVTKVTMRQRPVGRAHSIDFVVTTGNPNYAERQYIKRCKKLGVKAISKTEPQFKEWPAKKRR